MSEFNIPVTGVGPGSQPPEEDGVELDILQMPSGMNTYTMPEIPDPEEVADLVEARRMFAELHELLAGFRVESDNRVVDISGFDARNRALVDQVLAVGEVSVIYEGEVRFRAQESVLAGIWRVEYLGKDDQVLQDTIEIGSVPYMVKQATFVDSPRALSIDTDALPSGVLNSPPLFAELNDRIPAWKPGVEPHVINLSLLPQTEEDLIFIDTMLGTGPTTILSRGYGNCRIHSTATHNVWRVKYFNSRDALILNTIEVVDVPAVALASQDDIGDSVERLQEILKVYQ